MGKKDRRSMRKRRAKVDSLTPPLSDVGDGRTTKEQTPADTDSGLELDLEPTRLVARTPFNNSDNPADTVMLVSEDNVEFLVSRSILLLASPYFKNAILSSEEYSKIAEDKMPPPPDAERTWEFAGVSFEIDASCSVLDGLLRLLYPIPSPVFKEPVTNLLTDLPYRLLGPIFDLARVLEMTYVCQEILGIVDKLVYIRSFPEPGLAALRTYAAACRLKINYGGKLKAAQNALCIPNTYLPNAFSPTAGLETEGIRKVDIERFAEFHKRAVRACVDLFRLSEPDKYPVGLPDVYATFVGCTHCSSVDPPGEGGTKNGSLGLVRVGAARWWQLYTTKALERLHRAPLDPYIFFENFVVPIFREAHNCHACAGVVHWKWCSIMPMLAKEIPARIYEIPLDVDDSVYDGAKESSMSTI